MAMLIWLLSFILWSYNNLEFVISIFFLHGWCLVEILGLGTLDMDWYGFSFQNKMKSTTEETSRVGCENNHHGICAVCLNKIVLQETALVKGCEHAYWYVHRTNLQLFTAILIIRPWWNYIQFTVLDNFDHLKLVPS